jgi:serine/threonine-protein phosphatase 2B catalytic subunit
MSADESDSASATPTTEPTTAAATGGKKREKRDKDGKRKKRKHRKKRKDKGGPAADEVKSDDPEDDREMKDVVAPPRFPLEHSKLFRPDGSIDLESLGQHLNREGRLTLEDAFLLTKETAKLFNKEPNLLVLTDPITVCGDVHGQFFDLLRLMEAGGDPADTQYLFLGDYVDRGCFSTECCFFLFAHKITYGDSFFMIRGNHECRHLTSFFNFKDECIYKYNVELYNAIMDCFDNLPIAATINGKFLCCHGGLSPDISTLGEIEELDRFMEVPREGPFCDLLWADPVDDDKDEDADSHESESMDASTEMTTWFAYNETRQCSYVFGIDAVITFLKKNSLTAIIRAHEAQFDGYKMQFVNEATSIPRVITIFSAPNYCDVYRNKGACLKFDDELLNIRQFVSSPHPYYLPNFMDVFTWSLPFVAEKVTDMLYSILSYQGPDGDDEPEELATEETDVVKISSQSEMLRKKGQVLKDKVVAVTKLMRMYRTLKEHQLKLVELKSLNPSGKIPVGTLQGGSSAIDRAILSFKQAEKEGRKWESMPGEAVKHETGTVYFRGSVTDPKDTGRRSAAKAAEP